MTLKCWTVDVRVDFDDKAKEEIMLKAVRQAAKHLLTTAQLIADKRKPDIAVHSDDMFLGREEIELLEGDELEGEL
jgi:hypothetical protein